VFDVPYFLEICQLVSIFLSFLNFYLFIFWLAWFLNYLEYFLSCFTHRFVGFLGFLSHIMWWVFRLQRYGVGACWLVGASGTELLRLLDEVTSLSLVAWALHLSCEVTACESNILIQADRSFYLCRLGFKQEAGGIPLQPLVSQSIPIVSSSRSPRLLSSVGFRLIYTKVASIPTTTSTEHGHGNPAASYS
jgi:hypothetical protein